MRLTERYKPLRVSEFVGLEKPKKIIGKWLQSPQSPSGSLLLCASSHPLTIGVSGQSVHGASDPSSSRTESNWRAGCSHDSRLYGGQPQKAVNTFRAFLPSRADVPAQILNCSRGDVLGSSPSRNRVCRDSNHDGTRGLIPHSGKRTSGCVKSPLQPSGSIRPYRSSRESEQHQRHSCQQPSIGELRPYRVAHGQTFCDREFCDGHIFPLANQPPWCMICTLSYEGWMKVNNLRGALMEIERELLEG